MAHSTLLSCKTIIGVPRNNGNLNVLFKIENLYFFSKFKFYNCYTSDSEHFRLKGKKNHSLIKNAIERSLAKKLRNFKNFSFFFGFCLFLNAFFPRYPNKNKNGLVFTSQMDKIIEIYSR